MIHMAKQMLVAQMLLSTAHCTYLRDKLAEEKAMGYGPDSEDSNRYLDSGQGSDDGDDQRFWETDRGMGPSSDLLDKFPQEHAEGQETDDVPTFSKDARNQFSDNRPYVL